MHIKKTAFVGKECVACGNCAIYCPFGAITMYKGLYAKADRDKCKGCGKCVKACPAGIITCIAGEAEPA